MQNNIPPELKEVLNGLIIEHAMPFIPDDEHLLKYGYAAYTLGQQGREKEIAELKKHIQLAMTKIMRQDTNLSIYQELECALNPVLLHK